MVLYNKRYNKMFSGFFVNTPIGQQHVPTKMRPHYEYPDMITKPFTTINNIISKLFSKKQ
jgi:hypothetical protein